jgi:CRP/FNR family cyclic AMP-dependent transcriptional regulator
MLPVFDPLAMHPTVADAPVGRLHRLMAEDPDLGQELGARFLAIVADRLQASRHRLLELYSYPPTVGDSR